MDINIINENSPDIQSDGGEFSKDNGKGAFTPPPNTTNSSSLRRSEASVQQERFWVLLGTKFNTVENVPFVYFVGVFDDLSKAKKKLEKLEELESDEECKYNEELESNKKNKYYKDEYEIKPVIMNQDYPYSFGYEHCS